MPSTIVNQMSLFQFRCARTSVFTMIIATRPSNSSSAYREIVMRLTRIRKIEHKLGMLEGR